MNHHHWFADWVLPLPVVAAAMFVVTYSRPVNSQTSGKEAYEQGRLEAEKEFKEGRATFYIYGLTSLYGNLNQETGLLYFGFGCVVDESIRQRVDGHNDTIKAWIKAHGNPPNSFKPWEKEIFDPPGFFKIRLKTEKPVRLSGDGSVVKSPDGKYSIRSKEGTRTWKAGTRHREISIFVNGVEQIISFFPRTRDEFAELLWGPKDSRFAIVRCAVEGNEKYVVFDLERNGLLRMTWDKSRP